MHARRDYFKEYVIKIVEDMPRLKHHYLDYFTSLEEILRMRRSHFSYAEDRAHEIVRAIEGEKDDGNIVPNP
jgi:hypothetical protein